MFEAQRQWSYRLGSFPEHFRYQYVLSEANEDIEGFAQKQAGGWHIHTGPKLPVTNITDRNGVDLGFLLGIAVDPKGLVTELPLNANDPKFWTRFESYLVEVAGRYAFVVNIKKKTRLYTDPVGMIGAVYNKSDRFVASSPLLAIKRPIDQNPLYDPAVIAEQGGRYSLFHTADRSVRRLNPNHCLDLGTFSETRFWPKETRFDEPPEAPLSTYDSIIQTARHNIEAVSSAYPCALPVSGGQDSRLLLGFAQPHLPKIEQVYTHINNYATRRDAAIGRQLCDAVGVAHHVHDRRDYDMTRKEVRLMTRAYQIAYGAPSAPPKEYLNGVIKGVPEDHVILRGHQTDLLRAVFVFKSKRHWSNPDWQIERLLIVPRKEFSPEIADRFRAEFKLWQDALPEAARAKAVDFMFLEVYYNATIGASFPALWRNFYISPFNSRRLISLALQFDEKTRRASTPVFEMIELMNPALAKVPFDFEHVAALDLLGQAENDEAVTAKRRAKTLSSLSKYQSGSH